MQTLNCLKINHEHSGVEDCREAHRGACLFRVQIGDRCLRGEIREIYGLNHDRGALGLK